MMAMHPYPSPELKSDPKPEVKPEPEVEPEAEAEIYLKGNNNCDIVQPEPNPNWPEAKLEWKAAWETHIYIFAIAFAVIAFTAVYLLTIRKEGKYRKRYFGTLQVLLVIVGLTRFLSLVVDPYMSNDPVTLPVALHRFVFGLALPCLLSAFSLVFLTLIQTSRVSFIHRNVINWKVITTLCSLHFIANTVAELLVSYNIEPRIVLLLCNSYVCLWGLLLFIGFPAVGHKIIYSLVHIKRSIKMKARKEPLIKVARLTYGTAVCGVLLLSVQIYFLLDMYGEAKQTEDGCFSDPWLWWSFQSIARIVEILMSVLLLFSTYNSHEVSRIRFLNFIFCHTSREAKAGSASMRPSVRNGDTMSSIVETVDLNQTIIDCDTFTEVDLDSPVRKLNDGQQQEIQLLENQLQNCPTTPTRLPRVSATRHIQSALIHSTEVVHIESMPQRPSSTSVALDRWMDETRSTSTYL
jgi:hypothetical protein